MGDFFHIVYGMGNTKLSVVTCPATKLYVSVASDVVAVYSSFEAAPTT